MRRRRTETKPAPGVLRQVREQTSDHVRLVQAPAASRPGTVVIPRLGFCTFGPHPLDAGQFAASIRSRPDVLHFCDTNQFIAPTDSRIWDALLNERQLAIIPQVLRELKWWIDDPRENLSVHQQIKASLHGDANAQIAWIKLESPEQISACEYYVNLLGMRKSMHAAARIKLEQLGRPATNQDVSNFCQQLGSARGQLLGRQGENVKIEAHRYTDECLVITAIIFGVATGRDVTVVSSDEAVFDQFFKAIWLLDNHYRSMLMGKGAKCHPLFWGSLGNMGSSRLS